MVGTKHEPVELLVGPDLEERAAEIEIDLEEAATVHARFPPLRIALEPRSQPLEVLRPIEPLRVHAVTVPQKERRRGGHAVHEQPRTAPAQSPEEEGAHESRRGQQRNASGPGIRNIRDVLGEGWADEDRRDEGSAEPERDPGGDRGGS